ncbi:helix-turn-helix domain-containing protein [Kribbella sp. NPDC056345]|uniref:helix-turn-helix domain-containing protein n=1 Tax=Kribbella sp. NPDC056345 TaxID=3345789 RepID=UPI0035E0DB7F
MDLFVALVDVVGESLDDVSASGAELARRLHLSRFHCDRIATAVAGETPIALRRRLLLERAAYQLAGTDRGILDIAVDAGFGSHEAFTRAFSRSYGTTPKQWRRQPTHPFFLDAPSGVHFHPPAGLRLPARRKVTSMDIVTGLAEHHVSLLGELIDRARDISPDVLDGEVPAPDLDEPPITPRRMLDRMVWQLEMWLAAVAAEPFEFPESGRAVSLGQLRDRYEVAGPRFLELVHRVSAENSFDETFVDSTCAPPKVSSYGSMIAHVLTFAAVRRTLVVDAFRKAGMTDLGYGDPAPFLARS